VSHFDPIIDTHTLDMSIRELTRINKPKHIRNQNAFVKRYMQKYRIPKGNESSILRIVQDEMSKIESTT